MLASLTVLLGECIINEIMVSRKTHLHWSFEVNILTVIQHILIIIYAHSKCNIFVLFEKQIYFTSIIICFFFYITIVNIVI